MSLYSPDQVDDLLARALLCSVQASGYWVIVLDSRADATGPQPGAPVAVALAARESDDECFLAIVPEEENSDVAADTRAAMLLMEQLGRGTGNQR